MDSRTYYYARVSSTSQKLDSQIDLFKSMGATDRDIVTDKASGADMMRPGYQALKTTILRKGDTLVIARLDRLGRQKEDIKNELVYFRDNGIRVKVLDIPTTAIDFPEGSEWVGDMVNNILIEVLGTIAQRERENLRERQRAGIDACMKRNGPYGRPPVKRPDNWEPTYIDWRMGHITAEKAMEITGLKQTSFYKLADEQLDEDVSELAKGKGIISVGRIQRYCWVGFPTAKKAFDRFLTKHPDWHYDENTLEAKETKSK